MDSDFNDIGFLMENVKQEPAHANEHGAGALAEDVESTDTIPTYMTDFILDYINRSLKNEEEEAQPEYNEPDGADGADGGSGEETVEELIARAENMIRENTRQNDQMNIPETIATDNDWMQQYISQQETSEANNPTSSAQSTSTSSTIHLRDESGQPDVIEVPYIAPVTTDNVVISIDTDSDDEVIFVNSNHPARPKPVEIPVIDLSDQASPSDHDRLQSPQQSHAQRRRADSSEPAETPQEKQFRHNCAICLDDVKAPHSTICGHIYCGDCIKNALKIFKKCPTCNKKLKTSNVHPIYL